MLKYSFNTCTVIQTVDTAKIGLNEYNLNRCLFIKIIRQILVLLS